MDEIEPNAAAGDVWEALPLLLPIPRAAALLGISRSAAYRLAESRELPTKRMGGRVYVVTARLRALLESEPADLGEAA